jgi:hypothetical protein
VALAAGVKDGKLQPHASIHYSPFQATGYPATEAEVEAAKRKSAASAQKPQQKKKKSVKKAKTN